MPQPKLLADWKHVPVVLECRHRPPECAPESHCTLLLDTNRLLERIALDILNQGKMERNERHDPACRPGLRHRVIHLPVLVANGRRSCSREIEEVITRRFV